MSNANTHPVQPEAKAFPRPRMQREEWASLNGSWDFAFDHQALLRSPDEVVWDRTIQVPFSPETPASGIGDTGFYTAVWYRRQFNQRPLAEGERLMLHFEAVDYLATVWVNGKKVVSHQGGYTPFSADITSELHSDGPQEVVVRAEDDPADLAKPRGKQDWKLEPHSIWYYRTTGIWQTVWTEVVSATRLDSLQWTSSLERWEIGLEAQVQGAVGQELRLCVRLATGGQVLADDT